MKAVDARKMPLPARWKKAMKDAYEKSKEGVKDMASGVSDKAKSMMDKDKNA